jgi:hypothetical protein
MRRWPTSCSSSWSSARLCSADMTMITGTCTRCGRTLRSARAMRRSYGWRCYARVNAIAQSLLRSGNDRAAEAAHALLDGAVTRHRHPGVYWIVSRDGRHVYLTSPKRCNCNAGLIPLKDVLCWHRAVAIALEAR